MPGINFRRVKELIPIWDVLRLIDWKPVRIEPTGVRGPCPVHRSTNPKSRSFAASADGWYCHSCRHRGDQLRLYAEVRGLDVYAATLELCRLLRLPVPYLPSRRPRNGEEER